MKILFIFIILLLIPFVSGVRLGASNSELNFTINAEEEKCERIGIGTDYIGVINGDLKFAKNYLAESLGDYKFEPEYFKINAKYEKNIVFEKIGNKETEICLSGKNPGKYKGLFIIKTKGSNAAIGIIINMNIKESYDKAKIGIILTPSIFLSCLLLILLFKKSSKK